MSDTPGPYDHLEGHDPTAEDEVDNAKPADKPAPAADPSKSK